MPETESWQARISALCGGDTLAEMASWIDTKPVWSAGITIGKGQPWAFVWFGHGELEFRDAVADDPEEALAMAILAAVDATGEER